VKTVVTWLRFLFDRHIDSNQMMSYANERRIPILAWMSIPRTAYLTRAHCARTNFDCFFFYSWIYVSHTHVRYLFEHVNWSDTCQMCAYFCICLYII
jgi:hypothetical protein